MDEESTMARGANQARLPAASGGPILDDQARDSPEVSGIPGNQDRTLFEHDGRDAEVHAADVEFHGPGVSKRAIADSVNGMIGTRPRNVTVSASRR
jgi:hypothetical protein